ncbi:hypothetical protein TBR22_A33710 [Luteitalea sp. TBR-22]|uniref:M56 family metallopeptidase n=1 Tax=Luteitalea sp. TBR-22 TaxID=2802971 RepID=UPI001AFB827C|nr:M56 family metallopeptidase [Luteitalea sp. TBR-22]BCS34142.1 hypothetical protein TBR22_A33710 [Luteitalea sp. TBR-22]
MTRAWAVLDHPWLVALGWLVILPVVATAIPALALAVWRLARRTGPAVAQYRAASYAFGTAAVLAVLGLPLLLVVPATLGRGSTPAGEAAVAPALPAARGVATTADTRSVPAAVTVAPPAPDAAVPLPPVALGLAAGLWMLGATLLLARLLLAWRAASRLRVRARPLDDGPLTRIFECLSTKAKVEGTSLLVSTEVEAPVAVGIRAPAVLVPAHLLQCMPDKSLAPVLVHELTHVARRDFAANLAQSFVEALLFQCPAVWWMGARLREAREFCCDDASVEAAGERARYVEALTLVARLGALQHARPVVGMAGPRLITRVRRLLEGEPPMSMPIVRTSLVATALLLVTALLPSIVATASRHLAVQLLAAGRDAEGATIPYGFPQRQDGSALRILAVSSSEAHVCGTFELQNTSTAAIERLRFVGVLSFKAAAGRPVQILETGWVSMPLVPGATARVDAGLVEADLARREGRGEHVQAFCAVREIAYVNGATWGVTPNRSAMLGSDALALSRPTLPRAFVGQTRALVSERRTLCVDDRGAEYSSGAQIAMRDEPGRAARCAADGQWIEVDARTSEPVAQTGSAVVAFDVAVDGQPAVIVLKSAAGQVATLRLTDGRTWGFVPIVAANGDVAISLHDMSATPHRLLATRLLQPEENTRFEEASPALSVRLARD